MPVSYTFSPLDLESSFSLFLIAVINSTKMVSLSFIFSMVLNRGSRPFFIANSLNVVLQIKNKNFFTNEQKIQTCQEYYLFSTFKFLSLFTSISAGSIEYQRIYTKDILKLWPGCLPGCELGLLHHPPELVFGLHQLVLLLLPLLLRSRLHILVKHLKWT